MSNKKQNAKQNVTTSTKNVAAPAPLKLVQISMEEIVANAKAAAEAQMKSALSTRTAPLRTLSPAEHAEREAKKAERDAKKAEREKMLLARAARVEARKAKKAARQQMLAARAERVEERKHAKLLKAAAKAKKDGVSIDVVLAEVEAKKTARIERQRNAALHLAVLDALVPELRKTAPALADTLVESAKMIRALV